MADGQHGGYRRPERPAPVSPPGSLSQRTDGGPTSQPQMLPSGGEYGSRKEMQAIQSGAPMQGGGGAATPAPSAVPFDAPSTRLDEPVTAGADAGAGISAAAAGIRNDREVSNEQLRPLLRSLELMANLPGSNAETRSLVRSLKARLSNA